MSLSERLSSLSGASSEPRRDDGSDGTIGLVQRCVIIQKDEKGYGLTVSGDNPVYVASVKPEGAAAKAGVQKDDRIVKVNGTLVTNRNHIEVVKLIKSGSYVALTLMGKPNPSTVAASGAHPQAGVSSSFPGSVNNTQSNRNSFLGHITAPQPVDPDKDRQLWQQKVHMTRAMYEHAKEDFEKLQRQYVKTPSERLHTQLLDQERTVKSLELQLRQLTGAGGDEPVTPSPHHPRYSDIETSSAENSSISSWQQPLHPPKPGRDIKHFKQASMPATLNKAGEGAAGSEARSSGTTVMRSKSDAASRRNNRTAVAQSTFYVGLTPTSGDLGFKATSLPASDAGSMSDSPQTSPSISPTPVHPYNRHDADESSITRTDSSNEQDNNPMHPGIITIDDEDVNSEEEQWICRPSKNGPVSPFLYRLQMAEQGKSHTLCDTGPFSDIKLLEKKPAHMGVLLHYLISNSDPASVFFYIVSDAYKTTPGNTKDLRKWGYEIFSTFLAHKAPLKVPVDDGIVSSTVTDILQSSTSKNENEIALRSMFEASRQALSSELADQLADFRQKRDLGLGSIFGVHELRENMDRNTELKMIEKYLMPHLLRCCQDEGGRQLCDRDQAIGWALATFFRQVGLTRTANNNVLERVQSFIMKDKRSLKFPGTRRTKTVKGHQFNLQHFYTPTTCSKCEGLIWGVGYQGFLCQACEIGVHKQCVEDVVETCIGKKKAGKRVSALINPGINASRKASNPNQQAGSSSYSVTEALSQAFVADARSPPHTATESSGYISTQPLLKEDQELAIKLNIIAGIHEHSVKSIVNRIQGMSSPTGPGPGAVEKVTANGGERKNSTDLGRSESLKDKAERSDRPARRAKSDVDKDETFRAINHQSGSSSASSLSNRSMESPSNSSEHVNESLSSIRSQHNIANSDPDLDVDELPPLKLVLGEDVLKKLKPKEKKRQEVINELFHTEKAHLRNLKVLDSLFNQVLLNESGVAPDLARALFPNIDEMIRLHATMNNEMKDRRQKCPVVGDVGDILLNRFDGEPGEVFKKACAEYCRNQSFALDALKKHRRKDQRLSQILTDIEANPLCRKLELKDHVPCEMQRLTKYPLLIDNLLKYTQTNSEEYSKLEQAQARTKHILAYVNQAIRECENYHKLRDMQKRLDSRAIDSSTDATLQHIKKLDLTMHKLFYDGPLVWRLRSHRLIDLHVLLLEDILVLLQRVDDRLILKCQSANMQSGADYKYTHSPVLKLQNLLARNVATDKKAFFVINTSDTGPQIYELVAQTQDARKTWCKIINEKAEEVKRLVCGQKSTSSNQTDEMMRVRDRIIHRSSEPSPPLVEDVQPTSPAFSVPSNEAVENLDSLATAVYQPELIQPDQISISGAIITEAQPVLSPLEKLRRNDQLIEDALLEKEKILAQMLNLSVSEYRHLAQRDVSNLGEDLDERSLIMSGIEINKQLIQLISSRASSLVDITEQVGSLSGSGSPSDLQADQELYMSQLRLKQQQLQAQGASGQSVEVPVPMDQLRNMAIEMNSILSNLVTVIGTRGSENQSLRSELQAAKEQLDMLKAMQRQMSAGHPPSTPQSRPLSIVSMTSSMSATGESTDEHVDDDTRSVLNVAQTQELPQEESVGTVQQLVTDLHPQLATVAPLQAVEEDSDDGYEMIPENLPLPDDNSVKSDIHITETASPLMDDTIGSSVDFVSISKKTTVVRVVTESVSVKASSRPMMTDLDEDAEDGRSTPIPSPTSPSMTRVSVKSEYGSDVDRGYGIGTKESCISSPDTDSSTSGVDSSVDQGASVDSRSDDHEDPDQPVPIEI